MYRDRKEMLSKFIGNRIRQRREDLDLTQTDLSEKMNISRASISNIESGRHTIQINTLYDIADALNINVSFFLPNIDTNTRDVSEIDVYISDKKFELDDNNKNYLVNIVNNLKDYVE